MKRFMNRAAVTALIAGVVLASACTPPPPPQPSQAELTARAALIEVIPEGWPGADVPLTVVPGPGSMARPDRIFVSADVIADDPYTLRYVLAHEWGHWVAFRTEAKIYAPGFPNPSANLPWEQWAECVAHAVFDHANLREVPNYPRCTLEQLEFTATWVQGPPKV
jgi:hypothetical protein